MSKRPLESSDIKQDPKKIFYLLPLYLLGDFF